MWETLIAEKLSRPNRGGMKKIGGVLFKRRLYLSGEAKKGYD
jgi:hypothetical protein